MESSRAQGRMAIKKWRQIETMCTLAYESRSAYCLQHGGTCYISHSRWYDDVIRRCAERAHPVLSLITILGARGFSAVSEKRS